MSVAVLNNIKLLCSLKQLHINSCAHNDVSFLLLARPLKVNCRILIQCNCLQNHRVNFNQTNPIILTIIQDCSIEGPAQIQFGI